MARRNKRSRSRGRSRRPSRGGRGWKLFRPSTWHWFPRWVFYIGALVVVVKLFKAGKTAYQNHQAKKAGGGKETTTTGTEATTKAAVKARIEGDTSSGATTRPAGGIASGAGRISAGAGKLTGGAGGVAGKLALSKGMRDAASKMT